MGHEGIYSTLYNIINDIKLNINLKEINQTLNGYKPKEEDLEEIIFTKLQSLKKEIREKNSSKSIFRNKHFESVESSSAESNTNSPPKLSPIQNRRSLNSSALKPKPQFKKKDVTVKSEEEHFEIFNLQKRKRQRSTSPKLPFGTSPKDFFEGKIPRVRAESISSATTEDSLKSSNLFASTKTGGDDETMEDTQGEVIFEPWAEETIELTSTPVTKKIKVEEPPSRQSRKGTNPRKLTPSMLKKKRKRTTPTAPGPSSASLRRSPRKHTGSNSNTPVKEKVIVIDESPATKTIGLISSERRAKAEMNRSRRKLELEEPDMVEIGTEILDSEDTDPEDDVPLANLQPILANTSQIKIEKEDSVLKTPEPSKKLKKKKEEFFTISSVIKPPSEVNKRSRRSPVKSPQGIHDRYRATALSFSHMLNSDYVPPAADDEKLNSPTKTPQKQRPIEAKNLSSSMSVLEDISSQTSEVPALEDLEDEELAVPLEDSSDELEHDEEAQELIRQAEEKKRAKAKSTEPPTTPKKPSSADHPLTPSRSSPRKTPRKTPNKLSLRTPVKTPKKTPIKTPMKTPVKTPNKTVPRTPVKTPAKTPKKTPVRSSPRKTPRKAAQSSKVDENKNERSEKKKKKKKKPKKKLNLRALAAAGTSNPSSSQGSKAS